MEFCTIQSSDPEAIAGLLRICAESNARVYRKRYAKQYASDTEAWDALMRDYTEFIREFAAQDDRRIFALKENGNWAAALRVIRMDADNWYLAALETAPTFRRKGFARRLLSQTVDYLRGQNACSIVSIVEKENKASRALHEACGFALTGSTAKDHEGNLIENCVLYRYSFAENI